jgi:DNA-binding LytR/AlgR family response regulator
MVKVVIVEDEIIVADHLESILLNHRFQPIALAQNLKEATEALSLKPDLFLLDIRLSESENGIDFGAKLNGMGIPFVYITANNEIEVMRKAIQTHPATYITKPFNEKDVIAALELIKIKLNDEKFILIVGKRGEEKLSESEILYCQADGVYTTIITSTKEIVQRIKLKDLELRLSDNFIRVHRSYLVNKTKIESRKATAIFIAGTEIPISRSYKDAVSKDL